MADLNYDIGVNTSAAIRSINQLKGAFTGLAGAFAVGQLVQFSDGITNLQNKLRSLTPDLQTVNNQFAAIASIALTSRTQLEATADLYYRIQRSSKALGISQREVADITESLTKALTASGQAAGESAGPLLQLGQALQSGTFQGDELRSILEGLQPVSQALADELGVTVGELKKLGSEGQISADVFVKAMRKAKDSIDEAFGRTTPTITSALLSLRTNSQLAFDNFEKNTQTGRKLANSIEYLGFTFFKLTKNIGQVADSIASVLKWAAIIASVTLLGRVIIFVVGTFATLARGVYAVYEGIVKFGTWLGALSGVAAETAGSLTLFGKVLDTIGAIVATLIGSKLGEWFKDTYNAVSDFMDKMLGIGDGAKKQADDLQAYKDELAAMKDGLDDTAGASENAAALSKELAKAMALVRLEMNQQVNTLGDTLANTRERLGLENQFLQLNQKRTQVTEDEMDVSRMLTDIEIERRGTLTELNNQLSKMQLQYSQLVKQDSQKGQEMAGQMAILRSQIKSTGELYDRHSRGMKDLTITNQNLKLLDDDRKRTQENIIKSIESQIDRQQKLDDIISNINDKTVELKFDAQQMDRTPIERQIASIKENSRKAALEAGRSFAAQFDGLELNAAQAEQLSTGLTNIAMGYKTITDQQLANLDKSRTWSYGWKTAFDDYVDNATNAATQAQNIFASVTKNMEDMFVSFAKTGKFEWKSFMSSIAEDALRAQVKGLFSSAMTGASTGGSTILSGFNALAGLFRANGGPVGANSPYIVGERGPELFVPNSNGNIIPNEAFGGGTVVNYNIQATDAMSFKQMIASDPTFLYAVTEQGRRTVPQSRR
jgi:lambda family phage tail tape measure protein